MIGKDKGQIKVTLTLKEIDKIKKRAKKESRKASNMAAFLIRKSL